MNIEYVQLDDVRGQITLKVEESDFADKVKQQLKDIRKTHAEPGFRPGKVPEGIIQKKYGEAVKYDVINKFVGDALFNYIKEKDLHVLGNPVGETAEIFDPKATEYSFTFKVGLAPEINTHVDKDLKVPVYTIKVTDEMIDTQDKTLRNRFGKQEPGDTVNETALVKGVITELNPDGSVMENGIVVENGIVAPQYFKSEAQKELFMGKHPGDKIVFNPAETCDSNATELSSMLNVDKKDAELHKGDFSMDIKEIIVLNPAQLGEEFYQTLFGKDTKVADEAEYRKALGEMIAASLENDSQFRFTIDAKDAIMKAVGSVDLPDEILKRFLVNQNENLTDEIVEQEYEKAIRPDLLWELVREEIARKFEIKVEKEDVLALARLMTRQQLAQYGLGTAPDDVIDKYANEILKDEKQRQRIANQALDSKLFNAVRANVTTETKEVSVEEFNALFAPVAE